MRNHRNALLAGVAALALVVGAGSASAQDQPQGSKTAPHQMNKAPSADKTGQSARDQDRNSAATMPKSNQQAQQKVGGNKHMEQTRLSGKTDMTRSEQRNKAGMARHEGMKTRTTAQQQDRTRAKGTAASSEHKGLEGLQGNASGTNVQFNDQQRTQIRETVINARGAPRLDKANFNVSVGTVIPRTGVRIVPVPQTLVRIQPAWRSFRYFVWMDDVVIVNPRDMTIVAVVRV